MSRKWLAGISALVVAAVCGFGGAAMTQDLVENPQYRSWARWKPGTSVSRTIITVGGKGKTTITSKRTLVEVQPRRAVLEDRLAVSNGKEAEPRSVPQYVQAKIASGLAEFAWLGIPATGEAKQVGEEIVDVDGQKIVCSIVEFTAENMGVKETGKAWLSDEIPGLLVKMHSRRGEGEAASTYTFTLTKVDRL